MDVIIEVHRRQHAKSLSSGGNSQSLFRAKPESAEASLPRRVTSTRRRARELRWSMRS